MQEEVPECRQQSREKNVWGDLEETSQLLTFHWNLSLRPTMLRTLLSRRTTALVPSRCCPALSASYASSATKSSSNSNGGTIHITTRRNIHIEKRIEELKMELPTAPLPKANYNIICLPPGESVMYVSGHLPIKVRLYYVHACVERNAICYGKSDV